MFWINVVWCIKFGLQTNHFIYYEHVCICEHCLVYEMAMQPTLPKWYLSIFSKMEKLFSDPCKWVENHNSRRNVCGNTRSLTRSWNQRHSFCMTLKLRIRTSYFLINFCTSGASVTASENKVTNIHVCRYDRRFCELGNSQRKAATPTATYLNTSIRHKLNIIGRMCKIIKVANTLVLWKNKYRWGDVKASRLW